MSLKKSACLGIILAGGLAATYFASWHRRQAESSLGKPPASPGMAAARLSRERREAIIEAIRGELSRSEQAGQAAREKFLVRIEAVSAEHFQRAEERLPDTLSRITGTMACGKLVLKMGVDKVRGTCTARDALLAVIAENQGGSCLEANRAVERALAEYHHELMVRDNDFRTAIMAGLEDQLRNVPDPGPHAAWLEEVSGVIQAAENTAVSSVLATTGLAVESVIWMRVFWTAEAILAPLAARAVATAGMATAAAAVDGPLPVGEVAGTVIMVAGTAWSAAEFYKARVVLKKECGEKLRQALSDYRENVLAVARNRSAAWEQAVERGQKNLITNMEKELS